MDINSSNSHKNKGKSKKSLVIVLIAIFLVVLSAASIFFLPGIIDRIKKSDNPSQFSQGGSDQASPAGLNRELPENLEITEVVAEKVVGNCIETDTTFKITSAKDMKAEELKARLEIKPDVPFEITRTEKCSFELKCNESFAKGSIVNLELRDKRGNFEYSWAFQTVDSFNINEVLPADKSDNVPVNTGIEIIFSVSPDVKQAENYFEISPAVKGEFQTYRSTLVFIPDEDLEKNTVYTVRIKSGLPSLDGNVLENDMEFRFKTISNEKSVYCYSTNGIAETFLPDDQALIEMQCSSNFNSNDFNVNLYKYSNATEYYNALNDYNNNHTWEEEYEFDTNGLTSVYNENINLIVDDSNEYYTKKIALLPENLEEGWYLADITTKSDDKTFHIQRQIQIGTISVYSGVLPGQAAFFVNNTDSGEAIASADISINLNGETKSVKTDEKGTALIDIPEDKSGTGLLKIVSGDKIYIDLFDYYENDDEMCKDYYTYIYTDREAYLSTDTAKVWGLILPRNKKVASVPENLVLRFGYNDLNSDDVPITVNKNGTFTAEFSFKNLKNTWGKSIALMSGDQYISGKYVSIDDYEKPTYVCTPDVPENAWMPQINPVKASINVSFYDGTPAEGLYFAVDGYEVESAEPSEIKTDVKGYAESAVKFQDSNSWYPSYSNISFSQTGVENNYLYDYVPLTCFYRDVMLESDFTRKGETGNLEVSTSKIDKIIVEKNEQLGYGDYDKFRGDPVDVEVNAVLYHSWSEKVEVGSYYNYVEKKTCKRYEYVTNNEKVGTYKINTVNGKGNFSNLPVKDNGSYRMELTWHDTEGQLVEDTVYLWYGSDYYYDYGRTYYNLNSDKDTFTENQVMNFSLWKNGEKADDFKGRIFYTVSGYEFLSLNVSDSSEFSHTMTDAYIPNVSITGACFDGKHVYPISGNWYYCCFDPSEREIKLTVTTDKEKYGPGDTAKVSVKATDTKGKSVPDVPVSLSVVDEAAFAVHPQDADALDSIYTSIYIPYVTSYCSYNEHSSPLYDGGEKGGGGDDSVRRDFRDTAAFMEAVTGADGTTVFTVPLPDNLTTWRATVQSAGYYNGRLYAGSTKAPVIVTQPMFLNPIILSQYIVGDDINFSAVCNGKSSDNVKITAHVTGENTDIRRSAQSGMPLEFGKLPKGNYKVLFSAKSGSNSDAIELPFEVVDAVLETPVLKSFDLSEESIEIEPQRWPVRINFYNDKYILYSQVLNDLVSSRSRRLDINIAQSYASMQLGYTEKETYLSNNNVYLGYEAAKLLPYSEQSYELTALICVADPELVNKEQAKSLFYSALSDPETSSRDVAASYLGLAALSEPVLNDVNNILAEPEYLTEKEKFMLCAALAYLGDYQNALKYYTQLTGNITIYESGTPSEVYAFVGRSEGTSGDVTRLALLTASKLNLRESELMARYLINNKQYDQTYALELMTYLQNYEPKAEDMAQIEYTLDGKKQTLDIDTYYGTSLTFGEEQFKNADIKVTSGSVSATAYYTGRLSDIESEPSINVSKTYTSESGDWKPGELVKVVVTTNKVGGKYYTIEDTIPSGARFVNDSTNDYYTDVNGQRIKIYAYDSNVIVYYIRLVCPGEFVTEEAFVYNSKNTWGSSERGTIVVNESEKSN